MVNAIDIHKLTLEELNGVVDLYPWYGGARMELCRRMAALGALSESQVARTALHISSRRLLYDLVKGGKKADCSDKDAKTLIESYISSPSPAAEPKRVHVVGGDYFSQAEYAWTSFDRPSKVFALSNCIPGRIHPMQKPIRLYEFLLEQFGSKGDLVLDTHLGSGSSRIAARNLGFRFIGTEKDEYYFSEEERRWMSLPTAIEKEREEGGQMYLFDEDMEEDER